MSTGRQRLEIARNDHVRKALVNGNGVLIATCSIYPTGNDVNVKYMAIVKQVRRENTSDRGNPRNF